MMTDQHLVNRQIWWRRKQWPIRYFETYKVNNLEPVLEGKLWISLSCPIRNDDQTDILKHTKWTIWNQSWKRSYGFLRVATLETMTNPIFWNVRREQLEPMLEGKLWISSSCHNGYDDQSDILKIFWNAGSEQFWTSIGSTQHSFLSNLLAVSLGCHSAHLSFGLWSVTLSVNTGALIL